MGLWDFLVTGFYISDREQCTSMNGFNPNLTNMYGVHKDLVSGRHLLFTYIRGL